MSSVRYRPEIDGLRSIAVIAVILFHMNFDWIPGGYLGVDVFFVISGFLISSIILKELERREFSYRAFWARRVRRILPAMLTVAIVTIAIIQVWAFRGLHPEVGRQSMAALFSVANFYFWTQTGDYWGTQAEESPMLHTWSLSIEEQFYIALPVFLVLTYRYWRPRLVLCLALVTIASLAMFLLSHRAYPTASFYLLPTRAWELSAGCFLAAFARNRELPNGKLSVIAIVGLVMICVAYASVSELGIGAVLPVIGACLIIYYGQTGLCNRILASSPLVYVGKISYSLYLWHWPVLVLPTLLAFELNKLTAAVLIVGLSIVSYYLIERTTRRANYTVAGSGVCFVLVATVGLALSASPGTYNISRFNTVSSHGFYYDLKPDNFEASASEGARASMFMPMREADANAYLSGGIIVGAPESVPEVVVLGDSHGVMWSNLIRGITEELGVTTSFYSMDGVSPFFEVPPSPNQPPRFLSSEQKARYDEARIRYIQEWRPKLVIVSTRWPLATDEELLRSTIDFIGSHAERVMLLGSPPALNVGNRFAAEQLVYLDIAPEPGVSVYLPIGSLEDFERGLTTATNLSRAYENVSFFPVHDLYMRNEEALALIGKDVVYLDDDHLTDFGTGLSYDRLREAIATTLAEL